MLQKLEMAVDAYFLGVRDVRASAGGLEYHGGRYLGDQRGVEESPDGDALTVGRFGHELVN